MRFFDLLTQSNDNKKWIKAAEITMIESMPGGKYYDTAMQIFDNNLEIFQLSPIPVNRLSWLLSISVISLLLENIVITKEGYIDGKIIEEYKIKIAKLYTEEYPNTVDLIYRMYGAIMEDLSESKNIDFEILRYNKFFDIFVQIGTGISRNQIK